MRDTTIDKRGTALRVPLCAKCNKQCERLEQHYDDFMARMVYTAVCHGERERVVIERSILEMTEGHLDMSTGAAFVGTVPRGLLT
jgi:hypothetical protein